MIACIIPAYNEEKRILNVINVVEKIDLIDEIIIVNDGSTDRTKYVIPTGNGKIKLVNLEKNMGKGAAIYFGLKNTDADIILLLDADLVGLKATHIYQLLMPLLNNEADVTLGIFKKCRFLTDFSHKIAGGISGQRAIRKEILNSIPNLEHTRYGVEIALNKYIKKNNYRLKEVDLYNLTQVLKEEKLGIRRGLISRFKMYSDIMKSYIKKYD